MKFECPKCQATFSAPDEKIPAGKHLRILCPKCHAPFEHNTKSLSSNQTDESSAPDVPGPLEMFEKQSPSLALVEDGGKTCLLCVAESSSAERMAEDLRQMNYYVSAASSARHALDRLHDNSYDLIVLAETFDDKQNSKNLVLHHTTLMPAPLRRQLFVCLLSETWQSMDQMAAFRLGVNIIINVQDLDKTKPILTRALKEHETFYKLFLDELGKKGQL